MGLRDYLFWNLTFGQLQAMDQERADEWLASVAMYGEPSSPRFAAIWLPVPTEVRQRELRLYDPNQLPLDLKAELSGTKRMPTQLGLTGGTHEAGFRAFALIERFLTKQSWSLRFSNKLDMGALFDESGSYRVAHVSGLDHCAYHPDAAFSKPPQRIYALNLVTPSAHTPAPSVFNILELQTTTAGLPGTPEHRATLNGWCRAHQAIPDRGLTAGKRRVLVHYRDETFEPWPLDFRGDMAEKFRGGTHVHGPVSLAGLGWFLDTAPGLHPGLEMWPIAVGANGSDTFASFCVTLARKGKHRPLPRKFFVVADGNAPTPERTGVEKIAVDLGTENHSSQWGKVAGAVLGSDTTPFGVGPGLLDKVAGVDPGAAQPARRTDGIYNATTLSRKILNEIDDSIREQMRKKGIRCATIGVAKNGQLVLVRTYTLAEARYPVANNFHKFRWGSVSKMVCGMAACVPFNGDDPDAFLTSKVFAALEVDEASFAAFGEAALARWRAVEVGDLFRMESGFKSDHGFDTDDECYQEHIAFYDETFAATRALPLVPGDFRHFAQRVGPALVFRPPKTCYAYTNGNYYAASELLSRRMSPDARPDLYVRQMNDWWGFKKGVVSVIGEDRDLCLEDGQVPCPHTPGWGYGSLVGEAELRAALASATWEAAHGGSVNAMNDLLAALIPRPRAYAGGKDHEYMAGSGSLVMSAAALLRILAGMHPGAPPPVRSVFTTLADFTRLESRNAVDNYGLVGDVEKKFKTGVPWPTRVQLNKDGDYSGSSSDAYHIYQQRDASGLPQKSFSIVLTSALQHANLSYSGLKKQIDRLEQLGYWSTVPNLFPMMFP